MTLNIEEERTKLIKIVNDDEFNWLKFINESKIHSNSLINFLWRVLKLTIKYPQIEPYFKNILNYFTVDELENIYNGVTILHYMCIYPSSISLNAFKIIINYGVNININVNGNINYTYNAAVHQLFNNQCDNHINNILNLLIKYGANLNFTSKTIPSVLDVLTYYQSELNEETKNCIMTIIDFGGITNNPKKNNVVYDFIKYCECTSIKAATKNENNI